MRRMNKRGMLANLISAFIVIMIAVTIVPMITNQLSSAICGFNSTSNTTNVVNKTTPQPNGATNSFGGAGGGFKFGGYDGKVTHRDFTLNPITNIKESQSNCIDMSSSAWGASVLSLVPTFFTLTMLLACFFMVWKSISSLWSSDDEV